MTRGQRSEGSTNSNGHPEGWPSLAIRYPSLCSSTVLASLPAGPAGLPTWFTRLGLIDCERTAVELFAVESLHSGFGSGAVRHLDETETTGLAGIAIGNDIHLVHRPIRFEELAEVISRRIKRDIAHINVHVQSSSS